MKATCPNNCKHKRFVTVVHVTQDWIVDEKGNHIETFDNCKEVTAKPDPGNTWECYECGDEAIVE